MTNHSHQLYVRDFTAADQTHLGDFSCGAEPWSRYVAEWIRGSAVLESMERHGTRVWLYETEAGEIVGFGSLGLTRRRWPPPEGDYTKLVLIPMLGIDQRFHGRPPEPEWRYSQQMMRHLITEAEQLTAEAAANNQTIDTLILYVHEQNDRAIRFYERFGFALISGAPVRHQHLVMERWIEGQTGTDE